MEKFLLTCFLALLCLYGSATIARVADSPTDGADLVDKVSGPHRGGETRPDTSSSEEFGLFDKHLDPGAGEETSGSLPAPVTVLPSGCLRSPTNETVVPLHRTARRDVSIPHLSDSGYPTPLAFVLSSADTATSGTVVVYIETKRVPALDSLEFRVWNHYLNERDLPLPDVDQLILTPGSMYDGSRETARGQWESGTLSGYGRLTLRFDRFKYFDRFLVEPGDSVRVHLDFENVRALFSGPAAEKFRCQYELALAYENYRYDRNPTMFTTRTDYWGYSESDSLRILEIRENASSIRRKMEFISPGEKGLQHLDQVFSLDVSAHPGFRILDYYKDRLDSGFLSILRADLTGRILLDRINKFSTYYHEDESHRRFFEEHIVGKTHDIPEGAEYSAYYPEYLYQRLAVISALTREPFRKLLEGLPEEIHDQVYTKYIFKNYRGFKDSNRQFELALAEVSNLGLLEELGRLYSAQRIEEQITSLPLTDREGNKLSLSALQGKVLLVSFWLPGCQASSEGYKSLIRPVEDHLRSNDRVSFVYVSHDSDSVRWHQNISSGNYATPESLNLNADYPDHPFLRHYNIRYFPTYMVIDPRGAVQNIGNIPDTSEGLIRYLEAVIAQSYPSYSSPNL
jgi:hypothetical protein